MSKIPNEVQVVAVDLDGTLVFTDTLHESVLGLVRKNLLYILILPFWLLRGIAFLKFKVAKHFMLAVDSLPYNSAVIHWLEEKKAEGAYLVLCTAANDRVARAIAEHLKLFDEVMASDRVTNLKGSLKHDALLRRFGRGGYVYAGDSRSDLEVWISAREAIVVNANASVSKRAHELTSVAQIFPALKVTSSDLYAALRVHQWLKNLLLFVPMLAAHQFGNIQALFTLGLAFVSFSLCASFVYITNDLLDLESDRRHPRKRHRPFASARLRVDSGIFLALSLAVVGVALAVMVGAKFLAVLLIYLALTVAYSLWIKRLVLLDCLVLATLYTVRIVAGAVAISVSASFWLLAFSVFLFLSLAFVKRYAELMVHDQAGKNDAHGRGYFVSDASLLQTFGVVCGYMSALVMALYMRSEEVLILYARPDAIWVLIPVLLYWVSWIWLKAARGEMHDDPIIFALRDKVSLIVAAFTSMIFVYAVIGFSR